MAKKKIEQQNGLIQRIHHVLIEVSDLARSERFYGATLGLDSLGRDLWPEEPANATFKLPSGQLVVLAEVAKVKPDGPGVHTNFEIPYEDYERYYARLKEAGAIAGDHRAEQRAVGEVSTYFSDPDGHRLQLTAYGEDSFDIPSARAGKISVGPPENFPLRSVTHFPQGKFFLVHLSEGFLAVSETCTHMQCPVIYQKEHWRFFCRCHYSTFSWTGAHTGHIKGLSALPSYPLSLENGALVVDTDKLRWRREHNAGDFFSPPA
jgi:catechol 2,3-dioxygenase-like lactoylglutathione lyase family enzyme/nitrite reductase/ring-hydroxylating ferredoxin subunit